MSYAAYHKKWLSMSAIVLSFLTALLALCILEIGLRLGDVNDTYRRVTQGARFDEASEYDEHRFFKLRPNLDVESKFGYRLTTNSLGLRSPELDPTPRPGTWRIICVGDSVTFGWGVQAAEAFPQLLEQKLKTRYPDRTIEVVNAGMPAYSSYQGLIFLQNEIIKLKPQLVIFCFGHNDFFLSPMSDTEQVRHNRKLSTRLRNKLSSLEIALLVKRLFSRDQISPEQKPHIPLTDFKRRNLVAQYEHNLTEAVTTCQKSGIKLILMTQATRDQAKPERIAYNEAVRTVAHRSSTILVDPDPILTGTPHFVDFGHPDPAGHSLIAELLFRTLSN